MNNMRKNNNRNNNMKHRGNGGGGGGRRYPGSNSGGGGNRGGNDSGNIARQKHHATQQREKYSNMARDAQNNGDRVDVEYFLQHVDHYTRVLTDIAAIEAERHQHQREHVIASGGGHQENAPASEGQQAPHAEEGGDSQPQAAAPAEEFNQRQPRMTRQPRRQHSDNGAAEANANTSDIPLPDSILPPI